jgi:hypothetical protein
MTVTIHTGPNNSDLLALIRDLQLLDGGAPHRVRRAIHGSGAIVDDELALMWLTLTTAPTPEFLESLMRIDPKLEDLVGRRASDAALRELYLYLNEPAEDEVVLEPETQEETPTEVHRAPGKKASRDVWAGWARATGRVTAEQAETFTKAQFQALADTTEEG